MYSIDLWLQLLSVGNAIKVLPATMEFSGNTCFKMQNSDLVKAFLKNNTDFKLLRDKLTLPFVAPDESFDYDGGYVAILRKQC